MRAHGARASCTNRQALREDVIRDCLLAALRGRYAKPSAVTYLRRKLAERLGDLARRVDSDVEERRARLGRTEQRISGLVRFIAEGDDSEYVRKTLKDMEAQAKAEKAAIAALMQQAARPIQLPTPEDVTKCVRIPEGRIDLGALLRMRFAPATEPQAPPERGPDYSWSSDGCAGRI